MHPILEATVSWLFPPLCLHCQREGTWLCVEGARLLLANQKALINPLEIPGVDRVICAASYDRPLVAELIQAIKYHGWTGYRTLIPRLLDLCIPFLPDFQPLIILTVPLHPTRQRDRGFNQAQLIGQELSRKLNIPVRNLLRRHRSTRPQAGLLAADRDRNLRDAFRLHPRVEVIQKCGILVDDVITTGSTIRECASVLRQAGMETIIAVALAKG